MIVIALASFIRVGFLIDETSDACYKVLMDNKQPPFQIKNKIIDDIAGISEMIGRFSAYDHLSSL